MEVLDKRWNTVSMKTVCNGSRDNDNDKSPSILVYSTELSPASENVLAATLSSTPPPPPSQQRPVGPVPPAEPIDVLGELLTPPSPRPQQLQSASAAVHTAASAYRRDGGSSFGTNGSGSAGVLGEDLPDYEGSGEETDSDQEMASPRSTAARVAQTEAKALDTTAKLQSLLAQRHGVMNGAAAGGMDVATEDLQESFAPSKTSQRQSVARQKIPPSSPAEPSSVSPPAPLPAPAASQLPVQECVAAPEVAAAEADAVTAAAVPLRSSAGVEAVGGLAVAPPPPPGWSQLLAVPTPSSSQAPLPSMATAVSGAEPFSPSAEGWSLQPAGAQPPLPASAPPLPSPPPPPPLPSSGPPRSAGSARRTSGASNAEMEFIPLGRSSSGGGAKTSPGTRRVVRGGVKVAGTGKKSFLFSDEEQKALGNVSRKAKGKSGTVPAVKTKIKVKKPGAGAKPKVAKMFTDEGRASAKKVCIFTARDV